ncbi:hypothetical protein QT970_25580, partial [Microcoleus sp. herbarium8]
MKCVQCNTDNNLRDRTTNSGRCKNCNHPFLFDPATITDKKFAFTDPFFQKAIADISSQNMLFFTPKQFLYLMDKRLKNRTSSNLWKWILGYLVQSFFIVIFGGMFISSIFSDAAGFLIVWTVLNIIWIWVFFANSKSTDQSARNRRINATNLQTSGIIILVTGISGSLIFNYF